MECYPFSSTTFAHDLVVSAGHDVHAEINAISSMVAGGEKTFRAIVIVAKRERFTPCGGCMDWIMQHGSGDCVVGFQEEKKGEIQRYLARELMPLFCLCL